MTKKVSGVGTVKMFLVVFLVFVFSFLLTVNAFADYYVENIHYRGTYYSNRSEVGYVNVGQVHVRFNAYLHILYPSSSAGSGHSEFITGISDEGRLAFNNYWFKIPVYNIVDNKGIYTGSEGFDATASGTTEVKLGGTWTDGFISTITLIPTYNTTVKYILTK